MPIRKFSLQRLLPVLIGAIFSQAPPGLAPLALAGPPTVAYHGYLQDKAGTPVTDPAATMVFRLFDQKDDTTAKWQESHAVSVDKGSFAVVLGATTPITPNSLAEGGSWLEIAVNGETLSPRQRLSSAAYAIQATNSSRLGHLLPADYDQRDHLARSDNPHGVSAQQTGSATAADIASALTGHTADTAAHHNKTSSFAELTGQIADAQIPDGIARDPEIFSAVLAGDGAGSGLDADRLDGLDAAAFATTGHDHDAAYLMKSGDTMTGSQIQTASLQSNTRIGIGAGGFFDSSVQAKGNTAVGWSALLQNGSEGNTAVGYGALNDNASGMGNVAIGAFAGQHALGRGNVFLGYSAGQTETGSNTLHIGNSPTTLIYGDFSLTRVGIDTTTPASTLDVRGDLRVTGQGGILFAGTYDDTDTSPLPASGPGTRMMWLPAKAAFRAGWTDADQWDATNIGGWSFAAGIGTIASGPVSTALGEQTIASAANATAMGDDSVASGYAATALGYETTASGSFSTAMGHGTVAPSAGETVIGQYNTLYTPIIDADPQTGQTIDGATDWQPWDRLFAIGNGTAPDNRADALVILKNGFTGIGVSSPTARLQVDGTAEASTLVATGDARMGGDVRFSTGRDHTIDLPDGTRSLFLGGSSPPWSLWYHSKSYQAFKTDGTERMRINATGLGIGTQPTAALTVNGLANKSSGASWEVYSDERLKEIVDEYRPGLKEILLLRPIIYRYLTDNPLKLDSGPEHVGISAQALQQILPQAVSEDQSGYLQVNNDPVLWAMLNAIQESHQQKEAKLAEMERELMELRRENSRLRAQQTQINERIDAIARTIVSCNPQQD